jgi:hypothetical protein
MWLAASVKMDKKSLSATCNSMELVCLDFRAEVMTGKILSIVYGEVNTFKQECLGFARLLHDFEAVLVIAMQNTRSHEREDRHDIAEDRFRGKVGKTRDEEEGLVEGLWVIRYLT